jgi:hypothetical protein
VVGFEPGQYDLKDFLVRTAAPGGEPIPSMTVWIIPAVPTNLPGNLESNPLPKLEDSAEDSAHAIIRKAIASWLVGLGVLGIGVLFSFWRWGFRPWFLIHALRHRLSRSRRQGKENGAGDDPTAKLERSTTELERLLGLALEKRLSAAGWRELEIQFFSAWAIQFDLPGALAVLHSPDPDMQRRLLVLNRWLHFPESVAREEVDELLAALRAGPVTRQPVSGSQV